MMSQNNTNRVWQLGLATLLTTAGVAGAQGTPSTSGAPPRDSAVSSMTANAMESRAPSLREPASSMFNDAKIAAVASLSNHNEIQPSQLAVQKAQNAQVKQYAQRMITEHTKIEQQAQQMLQQKNVTPEHNALSFQLQQNLQPTLQELQGKSGAEFDKAYMQQQLMSHKLTLQSLDTSLIPNAQDPQLKTMLQQQVRPAVVGHLAEAMRLNDMLIKGGAAAR